MATGPEGTDMEEAALGHAASSIVEVFAYGVTFLVHDRPFLSMPFVMGSMTDGPDDAGFGNMYAGGAAYDK